MVCALLLPWLAGCGGHSGLEAPAAWPEAPLVYSIAILETDDPLNFDSAVQVSRSALPGGKEALEFPVPHAAEPFLFHTNGAWHLFARLSNLATERDAIALFVSRDGKSWSGRGIVLDEPFRVTSPQVFAWEDQVYMAPETYQAGAVRLYRADPFPTRWVHVTNLVDGVYTQSALFRHRDRWWMFAGVRHGMDLHLFGSQHLDRGWEEHPLSPLIRGDGRRAHPGGPVRIDGQGRLVRIARDSSSAPAPAPRAFAIRALTPETYEEYEAGTSPILNGSLFEWAQAGVLHLDVQPKPGHADRWLAAVGAIAPARPDRRLDIGFNNGMALRGISLPQDEIQPGGRLVLRFFWKGMHRPRHEMPVCFVHLRHEGRIVFQADYPLVSGREVYEKQVHVPSDAPTGSYDVRLGLYLPASGGRRVRLHGSSRRERRGITLPGALHVAQD